MYRWEANLKVCDESTISILALDMKDDTKPPSSSLPRPMKKRHTAAAAAITTNACQAFTAEERRAQKIEVTVHHQEYVIFKL